MNTYEISSGERLSKSVIDKRVKKAKENYINDFRDKHGYLFCERTKRVDCVLDCSHIISVKACQNMGRSELAYSLDNIELLSRKEHEKIESWKNDKRLAWYNARRNGLSFFWFLKKYK